MAEVRYTNAQQAVIDARHQNLLVSAAAGSGKTAVLTQRILSLLTDKVEPADIDRLLIVTFTKAAAAEMRERIAGAISAYCQQHPEDARMERQATLLQNAQITTIDSFCLFVVRNNFSDIGIDPGFRILDSGERELMIADVMDALLEDAYEARDADFLHLVDAYCPDGREGALLQMLRALYEFVMSHPQPERYLDRVSAEAAADDFATISGQAWYQRFWQEAELLAASLRRDAAAALRLVRTQGGPSGYQPQAECFWALAQMLSDEAEDGQDASEHGPKAQADAGGAEVQEVSTQADAGEAAAQQAAAWEERHAYWRHVLRTVDLPVLKRAKKGEDAQLRDAAKAALERCKAQYKQLSEMFCETPEQLVELEQGTAADVRALVALIRGFHQRFSEAKRMRGVVDFTDMEHFALRILLREEDGALVPTEAAREYREYFTEVFVDEYQDSNYVQEYVLRSVARGDNYFMVGDVKQSIYRFRLARPEIFLEKYGSFSADEDARSRRIDLNQNFRSRQEVIDFVNAVFTPLMRSASAGLDYDDKARLYLGADYPAAAGDAYQAQICTLDATEGLPEGVTIEGEDESEGYVPEDPEGLADSGGERGAGAADRAKRGGRASDGQASDAKDEGADESGTKKLTKAELECWLAADRIRKMVREHFPVYDTGAGAMRPCRYRDFVILVRSVKSYDAAMRAACAEYGIPYYSGAQSGYYQTRELRVMMNVLQTIDNPMQDIPLYDTMTAYLATFTEEDVARLRITDRGVSMYELLRQAADAADSAYCAQARQTLEWLEEYRGLSRYVTVRELIESLLMRGGYLDVVGAMPGGEQRRANLLHLLEQASAYEQTSYRGLYSFVRYVTRLKEQEVEQGEVSLLDENADVVRMMTIHKSKGLEFPIVLCMGLYKRFNLRDGSAACMMDSDLGLALDCYDTEAKVKYAARKRAVLADKARSDALAEEMRVLYVALTRAREKLILTDVMTKPAGGKAAGGDAGGAGAAGGDAGGTEMAGGVGTAGSGVRGMGLEALAPWTVRHAGNALAWVRQALDVAGLRPLYEHTVWVSDLEGGILEEVAMAKASREALYAADLPTDEAFRAQLQKRQERQYSHHELKGLYTKTSVSELKHAAYDDEEAWQAFAGEERRAYVPRFIEEPEEGGGALRGSAYHRLMELLPFRDIPEAFLKEVDAVEASTGPAIRGQSGAGDTISDQIVQWLTEQAKLYGRQGRLSEEYAALLRYPSFVPFLRDPMTRRMVEADRCGRLHREQPFFMGVPANELNAAFPADETILIQGVIDVYYEEDDGLVLLDYKTDRVDTADELLHRYRAQLDIYARALTQITGRPVKEELIYSFALQRYIRVGE